MAPKPPGRLSAKDISDQAMLEACEAWTRVGAPYPTDSFPSFPRNVVLAKMAKAHRREWIDAKRHLTRKGREALAAMQEQEIAGETEATA